MSGASDTKEVRDRARAQLDEVLVSRQVVLVTGKGGVGKSIVASALALRARKLGLRPVLFECDAPARLSLLPDGKPARSEISEVAPGVLAINQDSDDAIRDYAAASLPSKALADLLFENRVARLFLKASPSVSEMALVGRVALVAEKYGADGPVIVDLHATGHALSLLRAPAGIMKVLRTGPVYERARKVEELLFDKQRTALVTVALPEELPVTELLELLDHLDELKAPLGPVLMNGVFGDPAVGISDDVIAQVQKGPPEVARAATDLRVLRTWSLRSTRELERLSAGLAARAYPHQVLTLPYIFDEPMPGALAGRLAASLDEARP